MEIISSWLVQKNKLAADLSAREPGFDPRSVHVGLYVHEMALRKVILQEFRLSPVAISPQLLDTPMYVSLPSTVNQWTVSLNNVSLPIISSCIIIIIIIIIIIVIISFMQGIYTYIPETNCVPREYRVAAILLFLFMVLISLVSVLNLLYFYISTFRSICSVPNLAVFCSSLTSWFPGMLLTYFLNVFEIVPVLLLLLLLLLSSSSSSNFSLLSFG